MLRVEIDHDHRLAILKPDGPLEQRDFEAVGDQIDPLIAQWGELKGLIICAEKFPGWDSFAALTTHLRFVKDHHRQIKRIAIATDSPLGDIAEKLVGHFVAADVKHFAYSALADAKQWVIEQGGETAADGTA